MQIFNTQAQRSIMWSLSHTPPFKISYCLLFIFMGTSTQHIIESLVKLKAVLWTLIKFFLIHTYCHQEQVCVVSKLSHRFALWLLRKGHIFHKESIPIWTYKIVLHCDISWVFSHHLPCSVKMCKKVCKSYWPLTSSLKKLIVAY